MPQVRFLNEGKSADVREGGTILEAARLAGVIIGTPCGAAGNCGKCRVRSDGREYLACSTPVFSGIDVETLEAPETGNGSLQILSEAPGFSYALDPYINAPSGPAYGIALDAGTTTIAAALVNLKTGSTAGTEAALNPQAAYGQDVVSRIQFASDAAGLNTLFTVFKDELNRMITTLCKNAAISPADIYMIVLGGNTAMLHIAANISPAGLARYPYTPAIRGGNFLKAKDIGIAISKYGLIYIPPIISAYAGADITSGILASELDRRAGRTLFIDIGTNAEIVLADNGALAVFSAAAGPAFEGMNISCGMMAGRGAIESFRMHDDRTFSFRTTDNAPARGLCGSGLLDLTGELVRHGIIDRTGRFSGGEKEFVITRESPGGKRISLSQQDVRQVQLAKSAVRTGAGFLLSRFNLAPSDIDRVEIAGCFGQRLNKESLISTGLLPPQFKEKIRFTGNTSLAGAKAFLLNKHFMPRMESLVKTVQTTNPGGNRNFEDMFIKNLGF